MGRVADRSLAGKGRVSHEWARGHMPEVVRLVEKYRAASPLKGLRVGVCLHVTKETSVLVSALMELGARVFVAPANPLSTQDDIAAFLESIGAEVWAWRGQTAEEYHDSIRQVLLANPHLQIDDGADAHVMAHQEKAAGSIMGGTEETTTGVIRLKALEKEGALRYPIIAVNNAQTKHFFDNRYGTGQSTLDGILRATGLLLAGKKVVIAGYGWVGKGVAMRARGMGSHVIVTETDPVRALEAHMDGYSVMPMERAAELGDLFITCTGQTRVIRGEHIMKMKSGAILSNAGHFDVEVDVRFLESNKLQRDEVRPNLDRYILKDGKTIYLIGKGRVANLVAAEGHPPEVMSMSFANQLLATLYLSRNQGRLQNRLLDVPREIDEEVARIALEAKGITIDSLTPEQLQYAQSWVV
jgi:adenosylhomocysteinase